MGRLLQMSKAWAAVLDIWAERFFQELDYQLEAYNTMTFQRQLSDMPSVIVPQVGHFAAYPPTNLAHTRVHWLLTSLDMQQVATLSSF